MMRLTAQEKKWIASMNALLAKCPSERLGFFTSGDKDVFVYDKRRDPEIEILQSSHNHDFAAAADIAGALPGESLTFPSNVPSVAG